jgi:enamine deaminase RidA (YjgF/YER057c/UK114 family)
MAVFGLRRAHGDDAVRALSAAVELRDRVRRAAARCATSAVDMSRRDEVRAVRMRYFDEPYPASTLVKVAALVDPRALVEIEALAVVPR